VFKTRDESPKDRKSSIRNARKAAANFSLKHLKFFVAALSSREKQEKYNTGSYKIIETVYRVYYGSAARRRKCSKSLPTMLRYIYIYMLYYNTFEEEKTRVCVCANRKENGRLRDFPATNVNGYCKREFARYLQVIYTI